MSDWEHIVVDDGSDAETAALMAVRTSGDPRVSYVTRQSPERGANVCRNIGARLAKADLLLFLDDDDLLAPHCLAGRVETMRRHGALDFAVFGAEIFDDAPGDLGRPYGDLNPADDLLSFLAMGCPWQTSGPVWRRSYLQGLGGFDEDLQSMQDLELHVRALCARPNYLKVAAVDHYIRARRDAARTSTRHFNDPDTIRRSEPMPDRLFDLVERAGLMTWSRRRALLGLGYGAAERWARVGRPGEAMRAWREACRARQAPWTIALGGLLLLWLTGLDPADDGVAARAANRWRGWARFRQEPALVTETR
jgi:glycosyltransferase involved in cell wall biosynthesis